jgi:RND family efflux transporter MFP subunit
VLRRESEIYALALLSLPQLYGGKQRMNPRIQKRAAAIATVATLALLLAATGCGHGDKSKDEANKKPIPVRVKTVEQTPGGMLARYSGTLEPLMRVDMAFRVGGYVESIGEITTDDGKGLPAGKRAIDKGDFVKKGTVLARIRSADYTQKVATARASVGQAQSEQKLADVELERSKMLYQGKAVSKAELDLRTARAEAAKANLEGAIARSGELGVALDDTVLRAPMDGIILSRSVEVGTLVVPGQQAISVADTREVKAMFSVPQSLVEKLHEGSPLQVYVGADDRGTKSLEKVLDAQVTRIAPAADSKGRVFAIEAALPNPNGTLRAGTVVSVHVPDASLANASIAVPLSAVVRSPANPRGFSVFVLEGDDKAERALARMKEVHLGHVLGNVVTVTEGLVVGQRVVTVGSTLLRDGNEAVVIH